MWPKYHPGGRYIKHLGIVQFKQAEDTANKLELDGLVVIGGDDSNTNACLIAEYFRLVSKNTNHFAAPCVKLFVCYETSSVLSLQDLIILWPFLYMPP